MGKIDIFYFRDTSCSFVWFNTSSQINSVMTRAEKRFFANLIHFLYGWLQW